MEHGEEGMTTVFMVSNINLLKDFLNYQSVLFTHTTETLSLTSTSCF